ncbi:MAG: cytochrome b/b6 domain-containing protein [Halodesulfurarchaeum sp.]
MATETKPDVFGRLQRFSSAQVYVHAAAALSIFFLYLTGLPITFSDQLGWLFAIFGYGNVVLLHVAAGVALITVGVYYVVHVLLGVLSGRVGLDALPNTQTFREAIAYVGYLLGRNEKPAAAKYNWLQKAEIWVIAVEVTLISITGVLLWFRGLFLTPGVRSFLGSAALADVMVLIARDVHLIFALTMLIGIAFHLYIVNVKEKYPFNDTMFSGSVSAERASHHWRAWAAENFDTLPDHGETPKPSRRALFGLTLGLLTFFAVIMTAALFAAVFSPLPSRDYIVGISSAVITEGIGGIIYFLGLNGAVLVVLGGGIAILYGIGKRFMGDYDV